MIFTFFWHVTNRHTTTAVSTIPQAIPVEITAMEEVEEESLEPPVTAL